ncbi:WD domain, G-beta repeat-containing protein [Besnoitia besnoiti]|uniref:WD domain, G-beta repeat-containing protein n=1 Tax=Besnoitia besnoiti TaxID=94643 RepID=A0A2A9M9Z6_BESBE|nr:WD domain, G-beta repeat-containing protein [Besnoitia besnoiti]PFH32756.1 WD domain, G-beta repeat-containing protein [Besnoitia besnoiti]
MAAPATLSTFDTAHAGCLHSVEFDFFATRLATASSDRTIRLWSVSTAPERADGCPAAGEVAPKTTTFLQELRGHEGPVWQVRWAHPSFGAILASCGYDRRIVVWQQRPGAGGAQGGRFSAGAAGAQPGAFAPIYTNDEHASSVNSIDFCPAELGLHLAAGSSDGSVSVMSLADPSALAQGAGAPVYWSRKAFAAHFNGVNSVAWAPVRPGAAKELMLATGGCDSQVRLWGIDPQTQEWRQLHQLTGTEAHTDWVRDVAFQPAAASSLLASSSLLLASCSEDCTVKLWVGELSSSSPSSSFPSSYTWTLRQTLRLNAPVWRVSWSVSGTVLSAACGEKDVFLFRETVGGQWEKVSRLVGPDAVAPAPAVAPAVAVAPQQGVPAPAPGLAPPPPQLGVQPLTPVPAPLASPHGPIQPPMSAAHLAPPPAAGAGDPPVPAPGAPHSGMPAPGVASAGVLAPFGQPPAPGSFYPPPAAPAGPAAQSYPPPAAPQGVYPPPTHPQNSRYPAPASSQGPVAPPAFGAPPPMGAPAPTQPFYGAGAPPARPPADAFQGVPAPGGDPRVFYPGGAQPGGVAPPPAGMFVRPPPMGAPGVTPQPGYSARPQLYTPYKAN